MRKSLIESLNFSRNIRVTDAGSDQITKIWDEYFEFLRKIEFQAPKSIKNLFINDWHYNSKSRRMLHDSWLMSAEVMNEYKGKPRRFYSRNLKISLLLPYHDEIIDITYLDVVFVVGFKFTEENLGDLLVDELENTNDPNLWLHRIAWENGTTWEIKFKDVDYKFKYIDD